MKWLATFFATISMLWLGFLGTTWNREINGRDMQLLSGLAQLRNDDVGTEVHADLVLLQNVGTVLLVLAALSVVGAIVVLKRGRVAAWLFFAAPLGLLLCGVLQSVIPMDVLLKMIGVATVPAGLAGLFALGAKSTKRHPPSQALATTP